MFLMHSPMTLILWCLLHLLLGGLCEDERRQPPTFVPKAGPAYMTVKDRTPVKPYAIYQVDDKVVLPCYAEGDPSPSYTWLKDGTELELSLRHKKHFDKKNGSLTIEPLYELDEGAYTCKASNEYGSTVSKVYYLQRTKWVSINDDYAKQLTYTKEEGVYFVLPCRTPRAIPLAIYQWDLQVSSTSEHPLRMERNKRLIQDAKTGDLHITALQLQDRRTQNGSPLVYKCTVRNPHDDVSKGGSYSTIDVSEQSPSDKAPELMMKTQSPHVVVLGYELRIQCIFSGIPSVEVMWEEFNTPPDLSNEFGTMLVIKEATKEHERTFNCKGTNVAGHTTAGIEVKVETRPEFEEGMFPKDTFASEGHDVTFNCEPKGSTVPEPEITWLVNGDVVDVDHPGERTEIVSDRKQLIIRKLCRGPDNCNSDLKVIQCNITNTHGFGFAGGFLNVLLPTTIVQPPEDAVIEQDANVAVFSCEASTDPYGQDGLHISWLRDGKTLTYYGDPRLVDNGTALIVNLTDLNIAEKDKYIGEYACVARTKYSEATKVAMLRIKDRIKPPVEAAFPWWIIIMVIVILLVIIFFVVCCCCLYQQGRGDSYPVDEKERLEGNDPVKELEDSGFHDFQRPEVEAVKGSRASLTSTARMDTDEEASLASYGDMDMGRFTEDGSFIGQYMTGTGNRRKKSTSEV